MRSALLLIIFCASFYNVLAQRQPLEITEYDLDNGLHVILQPSHLRPVVSVGVFYRVGSKNEQLHHTGFAHFFEHLLFQGSENIDRGDFGLYVKKAGGDFNARTTRDDTYYYEAFPSDQLEMGLWLESERMLHAKVDSVGVNTQRLVVKEEKRETMDNVPYADMGGILWRAAFSGSPYEWTVIGSMEDLDRATLDEFAAFYQQFYGPENAVLSIVGDIDVARVRELVAKYFAGIPRKFAGPIPRPHWKWTLLEREVRDTVHQNVPEPVLLQAYRIPGLGHSDEKALRALGSILGWGRSSRLGEALLERAYRASFVNTGADIVQDAGLLYIEVRPNLAQIHSPNAAEIQSAMADLEKYVGKEVDKLKRQLPSQGEMDRVKIRTESDRANRLLHVQSIAERLAWFYVYYGHAGAIDKWMDQVNAVTREDVRRVAEKYLKESNRVTIWYLPNSLSEPAATGKSQG